MVLERRLAQLTGTRVFLRVTDNRRTMIATERVAGVIEVRLHHMFLDADPLTVRALGRYLVAADRGASTIVGAFIEAHRQAIRPRDERPRALATGGTHHDLREMFDRLNRRYFGGVVDARVAWGHRRPRQTRKSIKLGTYCSEQKLIRIHRALDKRWVPRYFVEYVLYHEMLHHVVPMPEIDGRKQFHTAEFRVREKLYPRYERATRWETKNILRLLRA